MKQLGSFFLEAHSTQFLASRRIQPPKKNRFFSAFFFGQPTFDTVRINANCSPVNGEKSQKVAVFGSRKMSCDEACIFFGDRGHGCQQHVTGVLTTYQGTLLVRGSLCACVRTVGGGEQLQSTVWFGFFLWTSQGPPRACSCVNLVASVPVVAANKLHASVCVVKSIFAIFHPQTWRAFFRWSITPILTLPSSQRKKQR